jgi:DNA-binding transcriptional LysR family regulator
MDLHLRDLKYFEAVASLSHMGQAGLQLGRTQPTLSKSIQRLEEGFGSPLFVRDGRGIRLTPVGEVLLARARLLLGSVDEALREVTDFALGHSGHVRIGSGPVAADHLLPELCKLALADGKGTTISIVIGPSLELRDQLRAGKLDILIGLTAEGDPDLVSSPIVEDVVVVAANRTHPVFRAKVTMEALLGYSWALPSATIPSRQWLDSAFASHGLALPHVQIEAGSIPLLPRMIEQTDLLSFVSRFTLASYRGRALREVKLPETTLRRTLGAVCRREGYLSPAAMRIMDLLRSRGQALFARALD